MRIQKTDSYNPILIVNYLKIYSLNHHKHDFYRKQMLWYSGKSRYTLIDIKDSLRLLYIAMEC